MELKPKLPEKKEVVKGKFDFISVPALEALRKEDILKPPTSENKARPAFSAY